MRIEGLLPSPLSEEGLGQTLAGTVNGEPEAKAVGKEGGGSTEEQTARGRKKRKVRSGVAFLAVLLDKNRRNLVDHGFLLCPFLRRVSYSDLWLCPFCAEFIDCCSGSMFLIRRRGFYITSPHQPKTAISEWPEDIPPSKEWH